MFNSLKTEHWFETKFLPSAFDIVKIWKDTEELNLTCVESERKIKQQQILAALGANIEEMMKKGVHKYHCLKNNQQQIRILYDTERYVDVERGKENGEKIEQHK